MLKILSLFYFLWITLKGKNIIIKDLERQNIKTQQKHPHQQFLQTISAEAIDKML